MGDLFDLWLGDDDDCETATATQRELSALTNSGVEVYAQQGNRDFLLGRRFAKATGCRLLNTQHVISINDKRLLLMHGDTLSDDNAYQYYRLLREALAPPLAAIIPLTQRKAFMHWLKKRIHRNQRPTTVNISKNKITAALRRNRCQTLIHGHFHAPGKETWKDGKDTFTRLCLNDWATGGGYVKINAESSEINTINN